MKGSPKLFILICLLCSSCVNRDQTYGEELGGDYFYIRSSDRGMIYKGDLEKTKTHVLKISGNVERYIFDNRFITAFRHITPLEFRDSSTNSLFRQQSNGDTLQYWIIDKTTDSVYGPLNLAKYEALSVRLVLDRKIKL